VEQTAGIVDFFSDSYTDRVILTYTLNKIWVTTFWEKNIFHEYAKNRRKDKVQC